MKSDRHIEEQITFQIIKLFQEPEAASPYVSSIWNEDLVLRM
jgi:hypothetical protein